jgi:hypothetical protein
MADKRNEHKVEVIMHGYRWGAQELNGTITFSRDGDIIGKATWQKEQLLMSTAILQDDVVAALEKKLKEQMDNNWGE